MMSEKSNTRARARVPMGTHWNKSLLSLLMALVMVVGMVPVTALAAETESHPTKVGYISSGKYEACYIAEGGFIFAENKTGSSSEEKWNAYKSRLNTTITEDAGNISGKPIEGVAYYDSASGVLYITGNVYTIVSAVVASTADEDVLKVVVDGNTNNDGGWCVTEINHYLNKLNIEFRNNGTLTLRKRSGNSAVLGVTGYNGQHGSVKWSTDPFWFGNLELSGTGKLQINVSDNEQHLLCGIRAKDISIKDNVSLDIKMGKSNASVMYRCNAAMICKSLTIDTTGTVQIDTALEGSFNRFSVFAPIAGYYQYSDPKTSFNLVNAQSVTLKANVKDELFDTRFGFGGKQNDLGDRICDGLKTNGWTVTKSADDAKPYTVTMTRAGMSTAAKLTVGDNAPVQSTTTVPSVTVNGGETVAVKASVELPTWLSKMYTDGRVKLGDSRTMNIYKGSSLSSADLVTSSDMTGYVVTVNTTALPAISFETTNFKPVAGQTYTVYACFPIVTTDGGKQLGSASVLATIKAVEKQDEMISAVKLEMENPLVNGSTTHPSVTAVSPENYMSVGTIWQQSGADAASFTGGETYTLTKYLTASGGYKFTNATVVSLDGPGTVTNKTVSEGGKKLTVTVSSTAMFTVDFRDSDGAAITAQQCFNKDETIFLPDQSSETPEDKIFAGWKSGDTTYQPGDEITVTSNLIFTETWKEPESYGLRVAPFSRTFMVREKEGYSNTNPQKYSFALSSTGNSDLGKITVSVDTTRTPRWNEYKEYLYLNGVKQDSVVLNSVNDGFSVVLQKPTESYGEPKDFISATVWLKITSENGGIEKTAQVRIIADPGPYVVSCTLVQPDTAEGATSQYKRIEGSDAYSVTFVPDGIDSDDVPAGTEVGLVAPEIPGYTFKQWVDFSATAGAGVQFTDEHSAVTSFVMPKRDIGRYSAGIFAVYEPSAALVHEHNYGTTYTMLDDTRHYRTCTGTTGTCDEPMKVEEHSWSSWAAVEGTDTHKKTCTASGCTAKQTEKHDWKIVSQTGATLDHTGKINYKCSVCAATKEEPIAKLEKINKAEITVTTPVRGAAPTNAAVKDTETRYYVADTDWEPAVTDNKFASGTKYTVKVTLEAEDGYGFDLTGGLLGAGKTSFTINGKKATVVSGGTSQEVVITYVFPATAADYYYAGSGGTTTAKPAKSPGTGDPGVMLYAAMGLLSLSGGAWVVGRKRKDK